jgi:anti-sigma B factor antagonist
VIVVHTPEELGEDQAESFEAFMVTLERRNAVLDLDRTETLDSQGLTAILDARDNLVELGGGVKLATTNSTNRKILEITRLDRQIEIFDSVLDAVKSFR